MSERLKIRAKDEHWSKVILDFCLMVLISFPIAAIAYLWTFIPVGWALGEYLNDPELYLAKYRHKDENE